MPASKTALKKARNAWMLDGKKAVKDKDKALRERDEADKGAMNLEEAKKIIIAEDPSKPRSQLAKIFSLESLRGQRVKVSGWVHHLHHQGITS